MSTYDVYVKRRGNFSYIRKIGSYDTLEECTTAINQKLKSGSPIQLYSDFLDALSTHNIYYIKDNACRMMHKWKSLC